MIRPRLQAPLMGYAAHHELLKKCMAMLEAYGLPARMAENGRGHRKFAKRGRLPDIVSALPPTGRILLLEIKSSKAATMSEDQERTFNEYDAVGALCIEVRELKDLDPIREYMAAQTKRPA